MSQPGSFRAESLEQRTMFDLTITGTTIDGVQPAALDQPQIHSLFRLSPNGTPLSASGDGFSTFDVTAFLDTGTSSMLLSKETAEGLGIGASTSNGQQVIFSDIGVGGNEEFHVSDPVYSALASFPNDQTDNLSNYDQIYKQTYGPVRTQIAINDADDLLGPLDILGMPLLMNKVMVMDPKPLESIDYMHTYVYDPGTPFNADAADSDPGIPTTNLHVPLSFADFSRFTQVSPSGAAGPTLAGNPFIGPDPTRALGLNPQPDSTPPVVIGQGDFTSKGSFLFDTGAAASFISVNQAENVHVHYREGTYNTDNPILVGDDDVPLPNQFVIPLGGIGGSINAAGFFLDSLTLPTLEGQPITFKNAPVLVVDITAEDPNTGQTLTLDGDFGMNYLVASADISSGFPDQLEPGAFNWAVFDQPNGVLGLDLKGWSNDSVAPTATLDTASMNTAGGQVSFTVTYQDNSAVMLSSIDSNDLLVTGPNGYSHVATKISASTNAAAKGIVVTYSVPQPAGNGAFAVTMQNHQVTDLSDNAVASGTIGTFNLNSPAISGTVFKDANANSLREATDTGLANWTIYLDKNNNGTLDAGETSTTTDAQGRYFFKSLPTGAYSVKTTFPAGYRKTTNAGAAGYSVTLVANQSAGARDFGFTQNVLLKGIVFNDANSNGKQDAGEVPLAGAIVNVMSNGIVIATRKTDATGTWQVRGLSAGTGEVTITPPAGYSVVSPVSGKYTGSASAGQGMANLNFGLHILAPAPLLAGKSGISNELVDTNQSIWEILISDRADSLDV